MKKIFSKLLALFALGFLLPSAALAQVTISGAPQVTCESGTISGILCNIQNLINAAVPLLLALGVVYFVWGVVQYVIGGGEEAKKKGRDHVIYGIIGLAIIIGLWGIVNLVVKTFISNPQTITVPTLVPTTTSAVGDSCTFDNNPKLQDFLRYATCIIQNSVIPLMFALAIAFFIWGIIQYIILGAGEEAKRTQGRSHMIWGIIALAVMLGVWGLVGIVTRTFGPEIRVLPQVRPN